MTGVAIIRETKNEEETITEIIAIAKNEEVAQKFITNQKANDEEAGNEYTYKTRKYRGVHPASIDDGHDLHAYNIGN